MRNLRNRKIVMLSGVKGSIKDIVKHKTGWIYLIKLSTGRWAHAVRTDFEYKKY